MPDPSVTIGFSERCWRFLTQPEPRSAPFRLNDEVRAVLSRVPHTEVSLTDPEPRFVVELLSVQASDLLDWLAAVHGALAIEDPRRALCKRCIDDVEDAIRRARPT